MDDPEIADSDASGGLVSLLLLDGCGWRQFWVLEPRGPNAGVSYTPGWPGSLPIEILSWGFPLAIVTFLSHYSYRATFLVTPSVPVSWPTA